MRLGEALALCPSLVLVEPDPQGVEREWEEILLRLEDAGIAVSPTAPGCAFFETRGVERLYGGVEPALKRALAAVGPVWDARVGAAERKFAALAAAHVAEPGQVVVVSDERTREFLAPLPLALLPLAEEQQQELKELGVRKLGELAGLPGSAVAERLGPDGRRAWSLARGGERRRVRGRRPPAELVERLEFPEAVGNELTLRRAFGVLLDRLLSRPEREQRFARKVAIAARIVGGASWRRTITLRDPTIERDRLRAALAPKLAELPAPVLELRLELVELDGISRPAARARAVARGRARHPAQRESASGAGEHRLGLREHRRGGGTLVARTGSTRAVRSAGRLNAPRPALVEANGSGFPRLVNRQPVALVREEWRVVDRWWTEEPIVRRYFELVLESGQNSVVFRDEERGCWFTQRA